MARIRSLKPELWLSPQVMNLSHSARLMFVGLITQADDEGRGLADARRLKAAVFPGDDCKLSEVEGWLTDVEQQHLCILYDVQDSRLYQLTGWHHQKVPKAQPSNYQPPTGFVPKNSDTGNGTVSNDYRGIGREGRGEERKGGKDARARDESSPVEGLDTQAWNAWTAYRIEIRRPLKQVSIPAAQRKLAAFGAEQSAVVEQSIANGWQGLFALKLNGREPVAGNAEQRGRDALRKLMDRRDAIGLSGFRDARAGETADQYRKAQDDEWNRRKGAPPPRELAETLAGVLPTFGGRA